MWAAFTLSARNLLGSSIYWMRRASKTRISNHHLCAIWLGVDKHREETFLSQVSGLLICLPLLSCTMYNNLYKQAILHAYYYRKNYLHFSLCVGIFLCVSCSFPHATDITLLAKFKQQHERNHYFVATPVMEPAFVILHFAGKVKYQIKVSLQLYNT